MITRKKTIINELPFGTEIYRNKNGWRVQLRNKYTDFQVIRVYGPTLEKATKKLLKEIK